MADDEFSALSSIANSHRIAVDAAGTVEEIADIVAQAKSQAGQSDWSYLVYPSIFPHAMDRAYAIDPDSGITKRLEQEWLSSFSEHGFLLNQELIEERRAEARYWKVLRPLVHRHDALCANAVSPAELMSILKDVTEDAPPEMDARFRAAALGQAYEAAWLLDPTDVNTIAIGEELDRVSGPGVAQMVAEETAGKARRKRR